VQLVLPSPAETAYAVFASGAGAGTQKAAFVSRAELAPVRGGALVGLGGSFLTPLAGPLLGGPLGLEGGPEEEPLAEGRKVDAPAGGNLGQEAGGRHAGQGVELEQRHLAVWQ
jgi:hypothetical protein